MNSLYVRINRQQRTAVFWGAGTFDAKELIKELGTARWNGANKEWEVSGFSLSRADLEAKFGEALSIEESQDSAVESSASPSGLLTPDKALARKRVLRPSTTPAAADVPSSFSVSEFVAEVRGVLRAAFPTVLHVHGVLNSVQEARGGRVFMDLVDPEKPDDQLSCVIWRSPEAVLKPLIEAGFKLEADLQVMFKVQVDLNPRRGALSLTVVGVVPEYTIGKLAALREKTNEQLKKEGLFDKNRECRLAFLPRRLGLLTSSGGTVINDFRASLDEANFGFELFWLNVSVQGVEAKAELIRGVKAFSTRDDIDAVLIFRGGGSPADLAVFNEYEVARAICLCPLPVFSAIGHQEDQTSAQDVSFCALGVPKDLGRFFADIVLTQRTAVDEFIRRIHDGAAAMLELLQQRVNDLSRGLAGSVRLSVRAAAEGLGKLEASLPVQAGQHITRNSERLAALVGRVSDRGSRVLERMEARLRIGKELYRGANWLFEQQEQAVVSLSRIVHDAGPDTQLKRGFSMVRIAGSETYITSAAALSSGDEVELQFHDSGKTAKIS